MTTKKKEVKKTKKKEVKKGEKEFCGHAACKAIKNIQKDLHGLTCAEGFAVLEIVRHDIHKVSDARNAKGILLGMLNKK